MKLFTILGALASLAFAEAFYLPGVAPTSYAKGANVTLLVNHLTPSLSDNNAKTYVYSYDYYYKRFHFCEPAGGPKKQSESLGLIIFGDRIFDSPFELSMLKNETCKQLCLGTYSKTDAVFVNRAIKSGYKHNWLIDGLPAANVYHDKRTDTQFYGVGFDLGYVDDDEVPHLYNHYDIMVEYHERGPDEFRVVGVTVDAKSMKRDAGSCPADAEPVKFLSSGDTTVNFSYSVTFVPSSTAWATRWDKYLHVYDPKIQWFSLINFSLIVLCLLIIISHILVRTLKSDISKYNEVDIDDDVQDETGWKLVHGDVFRPPPQRMVFSVLIGSGVQLFLMTVITLFFALFGLLSPSNRGSLGTIMFLFYAVFGAVGAFTSGYIYKFFGGENWKLNLILSPVLVPGVLFGAFVLLNFFLINAQSSGAVPFTTMLVIVAVWFVVSVPASVVGSLYALKRPVLATPVRTNQIPRQIPVQPWYLRTIPISLISGIFPFGSIAVEMYFIFSSLWFNKIYYMFGFLFFCFVLMVVTCSLMAVLMIYYSLCFENYHWQWRAMSIGGACAVYIFIHSLFLTKFSLGGFTSFVLYIGYSSMISVLVFLACGSVGFLASLTFIKLIYAQIKID
ncbi:hypothetical protein BABINDRAFT_179864 [Babjeviella inositovora NRRL Y-12698]|uniref:Transmembrane 9 superfamily member n=1 Tax=Babjeviella inositovora NRRL Y-12698 TaxID=984486 RepID=A0A1E3QS02_9ASCO|nr:uncharacterized protein BABINDRAFT_179864 [Babjeviella inositovora NRRL Y-12698]ODQ80496.1 hypothetical protein BABINDRAFT_179864 [Babjeviella inositovora NRRL Y-12698]